ncbi:MAG: hypothetical protein RLY71_1788 [Pseudomonadota bacterium]|jgi:hypothetical protein
MLFDAVSRVVLGPLLLSVLAGCALAAPVTITQPLLLHTDTASTLAELEPRLQQALLQAGIDESRQAGLVTAEQLRPVSPGWFALNLKCKKISDCQRVRERLATQHAWVLDLIDDQRRSLPTPPNRSRAH